MQDFFERRKRVRQKTTSKTVGACGTTKNVVGLDLESCTCAVLPDRVAVEVVDRLQFLIQVDVGGQRYVCVVSGLEVGHAAGRDAEASQRCKRRTDGSEKLGNATRNPS